MLDDLRQRPYLVFRREPDDENSVAYGLKMAPTKAGNAVLVTYVSGKTRRIRILHRQLPRSGRGLLPTGTR